MTELQHVLAALKRQLKARGLSYRDVAIALELSEASVKRLLSTGRITLERLTALCEMLGLSLAELTQEAAASEIKMQQLTPEQETDLVADPNLLLVAACALNHWTLDDIVAHYRLSPTECLQRLLRLDRLRLIDLLPGNRIRLNVARDFDWLPDGPIRRYFRARGEADFLAGAFERPDEALFFVHGMLTAEAKTQLLTQLRQLRKRFAALHDESQQAAIGARRGSGLLLALREWEPPDFAQLRRTEKP
jgi:DNA-binding Xre family transcriptional regulator